MKPGVLVTFCLLLVSSPALASDSAANEPLDNVSWQLLGWTSTGNEVVLRTSARGQRMEDGQSVDYFFELTRTHRQSDGELIHAYRHGEGLGKHPAYENARPQEQADRLFENVGLIEAHGSMVSPDGTRIIASLQRTETLTQEDGRSRCKLVDRVVVVDASKERVWVLRQFEEITPWTRMAEVPCPTVRLDGAWHPSGSHLAVVRTVTEENRPRHSLLTASIEGFERLPEARFLKRPSVSDHWLAFTPGGPVRNAYEAMLRGDFKSAAAQFEAASGMSVGWAANFGLALTQARAGDCRSAQRTVAAAHRDSPKDAFSEAQTAGVYALCQNTRLAQRHLNRALEIVDNERIMLAMGALFYNIDLSISIQVLHHAASHDAVRERHDAPARVLLAQALLEDGQHEQVRNLFGDIPLEDLPLVARALIASSHMLENRLSLAQEIAESLHFANPGFCPAWELAARLMTRQQRAGQGLELFRAAFICDRTMEETAWSLADLERLRGSASDAHAAMSAFLAHAPERRSDPVRHARRARASGLVTRLGHKGAVLLGVSCRRIGQQFLCQGQVQNTTDTELANVVVQVTREQRRSTSMIARFAYDGPLPAQQARAFSVSVVDGGLDNVWLTAGTNDKDRKINRVRLDQE